MKGFWKAGAACVLAVCLAMTGTAETMQNVTTEKNYAANGVTVTRTAASTLAGPQTITTVTAEKGYQFVIGGTARGRHLVPDMAQAATEAGYDVAAAINGDHFSFQTGVPLGMAVSEGRLVVNPVAPEDADEYLFHALGITRDGRVLVGENPQLTMTYTVEGETYAIDRINRTRESWPGAQLCLYTSEYGASTGTSGMGVEMVVRLDEEIAAGKTLTGTVTAIDETHDTPLEPGTVVLSADPLRCGDLQAAVGETIVFSFSFDDEAWNDVWFAIGGGSVAVENGQAITYDYTLDVFAEAAPRSAIGVKADGTLVMVAVDGRQDSSVGLSANDMAAYLAENLHCEYALLLDGGGSTALAAVSEDGFMLWNTPSEERSVGNGVLLVRATAGGIDWLPFTVLAVVLLGAAVTLFVVFRKRKTPQR